MIFEKCVPLWDQLLTLGDDALNAHHAAQQAWGEGSGSDVLGAEAALEADVELVVLLGVGGVHRGHQVLQGVLKRQQLRKGIVHQSNNDKKTVCSQKGLLTASIYITLVFINNCLHWQGCLYQGPTALLSLASLIQSHHYCFIWWPFSTIIFYHYIYINYTFIIIFSWIPH